MAEKTSQGQADKKAAEERTAQVAADNAANAAATPEATEARVGTDQTPERADDAPERRDVDAVLDPFPDYDSQDTDALKSLADARGVEINRDVEKAELIKALRADDGKAADSGKEAAEGASNPYASYDVMPLEELRKLADSRDVELDEEFVRGHLVTELRAADTSGGVSIEVK